MAEKDVGAPVKAVRRSILAAFLTASLLILALAAAVTIAAAAMLHETTSAPAALVIGLVSGVAAAVGVGLWLSNTIAKVVGRPIGLLLEQLDVADTRDFHWTRGKVIRPSRMIADLKLLQRRIREITRRSRQLIEDLQAAREHASRENMAKSQFLANMSHELRTPLNAILGYAMLLQEDASGAGDTSAVADLDRIQQAGRSLLALINNILDLSKLDTGRAVAQRIPFDLSDLISEVVKSHADETANGNRFTADVAPEIGLMIGDPAKIRQCLENLIGNAFKFTHNGSVSLDVSPTRTESGPAITFAVRDTGIGIAPDQLERLFNAFHQVEAGDTRKFDGIGLGLALVARLTQLMGGDCSVVSEPDQGSTFSLTIPLGDTAPSSMRALIPASAEGDVRIAETPSAGLTALIVDDDEAALDLMQRWLSKMGYRVITTTREGQAVELARNSRPDLILLDVLFPLRSGYDILQELQSDPVLKDIPTILVTVDDDRLRAVQAGAADHILKPLAEAQLRDVVNVYRNQKSGEILVMDDDDMSADLLVRSASQAGFNVRRASNGLEGLTMAREARPDAIVLDLCMPEMNGFEVVAQLSAIETLRSVPLIVVSAFDITLEERRNLASRGHLFFPKGSSTPRQIAQSLQELVA